MPLPDIARPEEADKTDHPKYCKYHRIISRPIEDCYVFKNWLESKYQKGEIKIAKNYLQDKPAPHEQVHLVSHEEDSDQPWTLYIPARVKKLLRALRKQQTPGWKSRNQVTPATPAPKIKKAKKKNKKKKNNNKEEIKLPEKSELQKLIDSLDEYEQGTPIPAVLRDFISKEVWHKIMGLPDEIESETKPEETRVGSLMRKNV